MARITAAAKALKGPFKKLVSKLILTVRKIVIRRPGAHPCTKPSAAPPPTRSLADPHSLRGATPEEVRRLIPDDWVGKPLKKGDGVRYADPRRDGDMIAIETGVPGHTDPVHSGPYIKISRNGQTQRIPLRGNPALGGE